MIHEDVVVLAEPFDQALKRVKQSLAASGFGTLTEIDMQETLKAKIDKDIERYVIVGACNPRLAAKALELEPQIGVMLPCNVVVREAEDGVVVEAMDPGLLSKMVPNAELAPIAEEAQDLIGAALKRLR